MLTKCSQSIKSESFTNSENGIIHINVLLLKPYLITGLLLLMHVVVGQGLVIFKKLFYILLYSLI